MGVIYEAYKVPLITSFTLETEALRPRPRLSALRRRHSFSGGEQGDFDRRRQRRADLFFSAVVSVNK